MKVTDYVAVPKSKKLLQFTLDDGTGTDRTILSGIRHWEMTLKPESLHTYTMSAYLIAQLGKNYVDGRDKEIVGKENQKLEART